MTETTINRTVTIYKLTCMREQVLPALKQADQWAKCKLRSVAPILQLAPAITTVPRTWNHLGWQPIALIHHSSWPSDSTAAVCVRFGDLCSAWTVSACLPDWGFAWETLIITHMLQASVSQKKCNNIKYIGDGTNSPAKVWLYIQEPEHCPKTTKKRNHLPSLLFLKRWHDNFHGCKVFSSSYKQAGLFSESQKAISQSFGQISLKKHGRILLSKCCVFDSRQVTVR